jgi:hypothetical protein
MAHFAEIDQNHTVLRVLVVPNSQEHRGQEFLAQDLRLGGTWIQCSYNNKIRKVYPGVGYTYDPAADVFVEPQPYPNWTLDANSDWQAPVPLPENGGNYVWNESTVSWELRE